MSPIPHYGQGGAPGPAAAAGWYPDPTVNGQTRYWDGAQWTGHTHRPQQTGPRRWGMWLLIGLSAVTLFAVALMTIPLGADDESSLTGVGSSYSCNDLAEEAVQISEDQANNPLTLLKVRAPRVLQDRQHSADLPTGTREALLLKYRGLGVWSSGANAPVM